MFRTSGYWFVLILLAGVLAFWPKYLSRSFDQVDNYTHVHAAAMTLWCAILIAQPFLVRARRLEWHRSLGRITYGLVPVLIVASVLLAHLRFRQMDDATFRAEAFFLYLPLSAIILFTLLYGCAIRFRRTTGLHARCMIGTALVMIDPVLGRIMAFYLPPLPSVDLHQMVTWGVTDLILIGLIVAERRREHHRQVFPAMLGLFVIVQSYWFLGAQGESFRSFADWFRRLPLT
jgi:hypothetical protein